MNFTRLSIPDLIVIEPDIYKDNRGCFFEFYKTIWNNEMKAGWKNSQIQNVDNLSFQFIQDNVSISRKNVIRGLHFQIAPYEQGKLVSVIKGAVIDVAVDIRKNSPYFGKHIAYELNDKNHHLLWIPPGFAHGFAVLEDETTFIYKCTNIYHKPSERGIRSDDPEINIAWKISNPIVSEKDLELPDLNEFLRS